MDSNLQIRLLCNAVVSPIKTYVWELMNLQSLWNNVRWYKGGRIENSRQGSVECQLAVKSFFLLAENSFSVEGKNYYHTPANINCSNSQQLQKFLAILSYWIIRICDIGRVPWCSLFQEWGSENSLGFWTVLSCLFQNGYISGKY